jgi:hypothetical protein
LVTLFLLETWSTWSSLAVAVAVELGSAPRQMELAAVAVDLELDLLNLVLLFKLLP